MNNIISFLVSNSYGAFTPSLNATAAVCSSNGVVSECPDFLLPVMAGFSIFAIVITVVMIVAMWKVFTKAGKPGWAAIIPIYNIIVLLEIVKKPIWWIILFFIPLVGVIVSIMVYYELAKSFGKGVGFTVGIILLPIVFLPILGFGSAQYNPQVSANQTM